MRRTTRLRYNSGHICESLNHRCRWQWLLKGVQSVSCIQYPWSILVGFWGKIGLPIQAILPFPSFVTVMFAIIGKNNLLGTQSEEDT